MEVELHNALLQINYKLDMLLQKVEGIEAAWQEGEAEAEDELEAALQKGELDELDELPSLDDEDDETEEAEEGEAEDAQEPDEPRKRSPRVTTKKE